MPACLRRACGRPLTAPRSVEDGYGPVCAARVREACAQIAVRFTAGQVERALQLVADGGVSAAPDGGWWAVSSDGTRVYRTDPYAGRCDCPAGVRGVRCYHLAAVLLWDV